MNNNVKNIMIVGVGGQGTLLASKILGHLLVDQGYDVKVSEVHGMSQRGGAVVTYVKYGDKVASPIIEKGEADVILSFELLESARWLSYLKPQGKLICSTQKMSPMPVITGAATYPENIEGRMKELGVDSVFVDALGYAQQAGSAKAANVVLLGVLSHFVQASEESWLSALRSCVPAKFLEMNLKAFELGKNAAAE